MGPGFLVQKLCLAVTKWIWTGATCFSPWCMHDHTANGPKSEIIQTSFGPDIAELMSTWHNLHTDTPLQDLKTSCTSGPKINDLPKKFALCSVAGVTHTPSLDHYKYQVLCMWWTKGWMRHDPPAVSQLVTGMQRSRAAPDGPEQSSHIGLLWAATFIPLPMTIWEPIRYQNNHLLQTVLTDILWNIWIWQRNGDSNPHTDRSDLNGTKLQWTLFLSQVSDRYGHAPMHDWLAETIWRVLVVLKTWVTW
jgi:hypothetical protein